MENGFDLNKVITMLTALVMLGLAVSAIWNSINMIFAMMVFLMYAYMRNEGKTMHSQDESDELKIKS